MRISIAQTFTFPGNLQKNFEKIKSNILVAYAQGSKVVVFPELCVPGYPAMDFYGNEFFIDDCMYVTDEILKISMMCPGILIVIGNVTVEKNSESRSKTFNSALAIANGKIIGKANKQLLPDYDIFFENRYFTSGSGMQENNVFEFENRKIGMLICEDLWEESYDEISPYRRIASKNPDIIISINASPFTLEKPQQRIDLVRKRFLSGLFKPDLFVYSNAVGGQDGYEGEIIFDGSSFIIDKNENTVALGHFCEEELITYDENMTPHHIELSRNKIEWVYKSIISGIQSYFERCSIDKAIIGLSGGIDSAVTAALAVSALGSENVIGITMPYRKYSSPESVQYSQKLATNLGMECKCVSIDDVVNFLKQSVESIIEVGIEGTLTEENLQARARANIIMGVSNSLPGSLVLSTGNKTEMALGYCTAYGDMCGGLAILSDLTKMMVRELGFYINQMNGGSIIPISILNKPPSAELGKDQIDEESLGAPYDILDVLVEDIIEGELCKMETMEKIHDNSSFANRMYDYASLYDKCYNMIKNNEWKRRQAPPGIKVTKKSFGSGRRVPMSHQFFLI